MNCPFSVCSSGKSQSCRLTQCALASAQLAGPTGPPEPPGTQARVLREHGEGWRAPIVLAASAWGRHSPPAARHANDARHIAPSSARRLGSVAVALRSRLRNVSQLAPTRVVYVVVVWGPRLVLGQLAQLATLTG